MLRNLSAAAMTCALLAPTHSQAAGPSLVTPNFLLNYPKNTIVNDYRPAIDIYGKRIVFERSLDYDPKANPPSYVNSNLVIVDLAKPNRVSFLVKPNNRYGISSSARADWCWAPGGTGAYRPITFSVGGGFVDNDGVDDIAAGDGVYIIDPDTRELSFVPGSIASIYPTWYPQCKVLAVYADDALPFKYGSPGNPQIARGPQAQRINPANGGLQKVLSGEKIWAGFTSVNPKTSTLIAFAGQRLSSAGYNQNTNYIYLADTSADPPRIWPLESDASATTYDPAHQGRAPTWSPDGKWIAFESNRACKNLSQYALYLQDSKASKTPPQQLTDCMYNGQHAKWYPEKVNGRTLLIASFLLAPTANPKTMPAVAASRGVASIDITDFLQPSTR